jgi:hypothetical protein
MSTFNGGEACLKEKRKFIVHGREYWWTYDEMKEELGIDDEEAKEIWESAKPKKYKKRIHRRKK